MAPFAFASWYPTLSLRAHKTFTIGFSAPPALRPLFGIQVEACSLSGTKTLTPGVPMPRGFCSLLDVLVPYLHYGILRIRKIFTLDVTMLKDSRPLLSPRLLQLHYREQPPETRGLVDHKRHESAPCPRRPLTATRSCHFTRPLLNWGLGDA